MKERVIGSLFLILIVLIISFNAFKAKGLDNIKKYQDEIKQGEVKKEERFFYDETSKISDSQWIIQVDTFEKIEPALLLAEKLENQRFNAYIIKKTIAEKRIYRVRIYSKNSDDAIDETIEKLKESGYSVSIIKKW